MPLADTAIKNASPARSRSSCQTRTGTGGNNTVGCDGERRMMGSVQIFIWTYHPARKQFVSGTL
jgi:hypothetical protein